MKTLIEALVDLDPENPNHWTSDGLPKLDALKFATGNASLTRSDVTDAAPLFTRDNRVIEEPEPEQPLASADPDLRVTIEQEKAHEKESKVIASMEVKVTLSQALRNLLEPTKVGNVAELSDEEIKAKLDTLSNVVKEIQDSRSALTEMITNVQSDMDKLIVEQEARRPKSKMTATQMYLEAQKKRGPQDMMSDHIFQNPIDDPVARMVARNMMRRG